MLPIIEEQNDLPEEMATPDDLEAIRIAREEFARGETIPHDAINWN